MKVRRVVLDTNVLISAFLSSNGSPAKALTTCLQPEFELLFSEATLAEFTSRILRPKFDRYRSGEALEQFLIELTELAVWIEPEPTFEVCRDPDDNKFLDLAVLGQAHTIVTGDKDLLVLNPFEGVGIVSAKEFIESSKLI